MSERKTCMEEYEINGADSDCGSNSQSGSSASAVSNAERNTHEGQYETDEWSRNFCPHIYDVAGRVHTIFTQAFNIAGEFLVIHRLRVSVCFFEIIGFFLKRKNFFLKNFAVDFPLFSEVMDCACAEFPMLFQRRPYYLNRVNTLR